MTQQDKNNSWKMDINANKVPFHLIVLWCKNYINLGKFRFANNGSFYFSTPLFDNTTVDVESSIKLQNTFYKSSKSSSLLKGWVKTAQEQFKVYKIIQKNEPEYTVLFRQKYNALCQSMELALKAYLISRDHSVDEIKKIGHDLIKLLNVAYTQHELTIRPKVYEMIRVINPAYKSRKLLYFENEYILPADISSIESFTHLLISKITFDSQKNL